MSHMRVIALLMFSTTALHASTAFGQVLFPPTQTRSSAGRTTERDVPTCQAAAGGSRMRANCEPVEPNQTTRTEHRITVAIEVLPPTGPQCEATTATEYMQRNTVASVASTISIANCPAGSAGTFDVVARVKDASGEINPIEFSEIWQRDDAQDVKFEIDYPLGDNVDLVSVRVRNLRCTCTEVPAASSASDTSIEPEPAQR